MPAFDFKCAHCGYLVTVHYTSYTTAPRAIQCPGCMHSQAERQPSAPNFNIQGFNAKNGYSK